MSSFGQVKAGDTGGSNATNLALTFTNTTTAGNKIKLAVAVFASIAGVHPSFEVVDNKGNYFQPAVRNVDSAGGDEVTLQVFDALNIAGGSSHQVTVNLLGGATGLIAISMMEVSGPSTWDQQDVSSSSSGSSTTPTAAAVTTTIANVFGFSATYLPDNDDAGLTAGTNWTEPTGAQTDTTGESLSTMYRVISGTGSYSAPWQGISSARWRCVSTFDPDHTTHPPHVPDEAPMPSRSSVR